MKVLLIVGNDKISGNAIKSLCIKDSNVLIAIDNSSNIFRVFKLVWKKRISARLILKMFVCSLLRKGNPPKFDYRKISTNEDIQNLIRTNEINLVLLFRAGLLINRKTLELGTPILNIHSSRLPKYGGLGTIQRALDDKDCEQNATLHIVTESIDKGRILDTEAYTLNLKKSYCENENTAYDAGTRLLKRTIDELGTNKSKVKMDILLEE